MEKKIEPLARKLDGPTPDLKDIDEYHEAVRTQVVNELSAYLLLSIFDETGDSTDKLLERIEKDDHIPKSLKKEVYDRCVVCINKLLIDFAKQLPEGRGEANVRSKSVSEETTA